MPLLRGGTEALTDSSAGDTVEAVGSTDRRLVISAQPLNGPGRLVVTDSEGTVTAQMEIGPTDGRTTACVAGGELVVLTSETDDAMSADAVVVRGGPVDGDLPNELTAWPVRSRLDMGDRHVGTGAGRLACTDDRIVWVAQSGGGVSAAVVPNGPDERPVVVDLPGGDQAQLTSLCQTDEGVVVSAASPDRTTWRYWSLDPDAGGFGSPRSLTHDEPVNVAPRGCAVDGAIIDAGLPDVSGGGLAIVP